METKNLEYQLKYGLLEFILDLIPQGFALLLCVKTAEYSINRIKRTSSPIPRLGLAVVTASVLVFGVVFLYEIFDSVITGCNRKVCLLHYKDCFLFFFGCRCHYFRRSDIFAFNFDPERRKMKIAVSRCLEKRKGIYSYKRLFTEAGKSYSPASAEEYLSPLIEGGLDQIKFGSPEYYGCSVNPFAWTALTHIQHIEMDGTFEFSLPCPSGDIASEIISEITGAKNLKTIFSSL